MGVKEEKAIRNLLGYEEDTAGRIMTNQFVALPATATVQDAIDALRGLDEDFESIYYVYTTDVEGALTGVLSMRSLVVAEHTDRLKDLAYRDVVWVAPDLDQELVADEMTKYDLVAIPVCDENRHILGIVTVDDALDVIAEEHAEDPADCRCLREREQRGRVPRTRSPGSPSVSTGSWCGLSPPAPSRLSW